MTILEAFKFRIECISKEISDLEKTSIDKPAISRLIKGKKVTISLYEKALKKEKEEISKRLFIGVFPGGISYADRETEEYGDYKKLAFLPYDTLELRFYHDCPEMLKDFIKNDASRYHTGQTFAISASGQTALLGMGT